MFWRKSADIIDVEWLKWCTHHCSCVCTVCTMEAFFLCHRNHTHLYHRRSNMI